MPDTVIKTMLKETSLLTDARWSAWLELDGDKWKPHAVYKLNKKQLNDLRVSLDNRQFISWLSSAMAAKRDRSREAPPSMKAQGSRLYVFPGQAAKGMILVGADGLSTEARRIWHVLALGNSNHVLEIPGPPQDLAAEDLGIPYYFPQAQEKILAYVLRSVECQGGWLAIRSGDVFEIKASYKVAPLKEPRLPIEANPLLRKICQTQMAHIVMKEELEWAMIPRTGLQTNSSYWVALPLVIGRRVIGLIAFWKVAPIQLADLDQLKKTCTNVTPAVEASITFADITNHLRRMALLNDFALTVSSALDLEQIAQRIFALVQRAFETERIILFILSSDERTLYNYYSKDGKIVLQAQSVDGNSIHWPMERGEVFRGETITASSEYQVIYDDSKSALLAPLKYRRQVIGALGLESTREGAFSVHDEHLLVVVASHLAGLIENGRLRQEAELRARNLSLIHAVVEHVIGLTDDRQVAQVTAELLTHNYSYEMAAVLLFDKSYEKLKLAGIAGTAADVVQQGLRYMDIPSQGGITSRVSITGQSMLVNDVTQDPIYHPIPDWEAGSEMCVALREGDRIIGVIDVESQHKNAFTQNDLLLLEALAGILSNVITNVGQYQKLQATVNQLQAAREELQKRISAQRETESRLIQAAKLVAVGEMAAGVAHELNNPLTTVSGFVELVRNELPTDSSAYNDLELVLHEANRARGVVRRLLDFARQSESTRARSDLNEIVNDILALVDHLLQTSNVGVTTQLQDHLPWILVDRNQIKQVVINLIHNAIHAMPKGGSLFVATEKGERDDREWLKLIVRDSGIGIPAENIERVFEPFFTTRSKEGGTGLGLSVSYGIISDHGGTIEVKSEVGKGSEFTIWLPVEVE